MRNQSPEDVVNHWLVCVGELNALDTLDELSSLSSANWWQHNAWCWRPVSKGVMAHLLPQLYIPRESRTSLESLMQVTEATAENELLLIEVPLLCPKPTDQDNQRLFDIFIDIWFRARCLLVKCSEVVTCNTPCAPGLRRSNVSRPAQAFL